MPPSHATLLIRRLVGHPPLLRGIVLRVALIWVAIRIALHGATMLLRMDGQPSVLGLVVAITAIVVFDARVTRELLYLRNLGLSAGWLATVAAVSVLAFETLARLIV